MCSKNSEPQANRLISQCLVTHQLNKTVYAAFFNIQCHCPHKSMLPSFFWKHKRKFFFFFTKFFYISFLLSIINFRELYLLLSLRLASAKIFYFDVSYWVYSIELKRPYIIIVLSFSYFIYSIYLTWTFFNHPNCYFS